MVSVRGIQRRKTPFGGERVKEGFLEEVDLSRIKVK